MSYKLTYFNGRGRGECSRMLFAAAGKKFEDNRIEFADWPTVKPTTPHGSLPVLEADGKQISLSTSIARFLAREFSLYGKGNAEATLIDMIFDTLVDMLDAHVRLAFSSADNKEEQIAEFQKEKIPNFLGILEKLVGELGKGGFAVGSSLSLADIALNVYIEGVKAQDSLEKFPKLAENRKKVAALPKIKEYLEKRPKTDF